MIHQAVVVAGGKGLRLGSLARRYGNKSLVPVARKPLIYHTVSWLKDAGVAEIVITVNYTTELRKITVLFKGDPSVAVIGNLSRESSAQCLPPIRGLLDERFLFVYGHAPVPPEHLEKLNAFPEGVVVSLYQTTTQRELTKKPAVLEEQRVIFAEEDNLFIEPPHILNYDFIDILTQTESWKISFHSYRGPIFGVQADHPSEFHYPNDFKQVREWLLTRLQRMKRGECFGEVVKSYERYRKSHPNEVFTKFFSLMRGGETLTVLDLACGSGKSTEPLIRKKVNVAGCDPDLRMLRKAITSAKKKHLPVVYTRGHAEKMPFPDDNFDAVTVGSAFHWFAHEQAVAEIKRVLKPGGLVYIFSYRYPTTEREEEYNEEASLLRDCGIEYPARERVRATSEYIKKLLESGGFEKIQSYTITKLRRYSVEDRVGRVKATSAYALLSSKDKRRVTARLTKILKQKWGKRRYRLIPQIVSVCYGYKPK